MRQNYATKLQKIFDICNNKPLFLYVLCDFLGLGAKFAVQR